MFREWRRRTGRSRISRGNAYEITNLVTNLQILFKQMKKEIIFTILILSLVVTGCVSKTSPAVENVGGETTDDRQQTTENTETQKQTVEDEDESKTILNTKIVEGTEGWRVYEKKDMDVRLKYYKDWYYDRDEQAEKELGYDLYVGFAESADVLEQGRPYPIEFIIASGDQELHQGLEFSKVIYNTDDVDYILTTSDKNKYIDILDKMAESFEFMDEVQIDKLKEKQIIENKIYSLGLERGFIKGDEIIIYLYEGYLDEDKKQQYKKSKNLSFVGNINKIEFPSILIPKNFYYNRLEITTEVKGPYQIYKPVTKVNYQCDGPLIYYSNGEPVNYQYCETNGKDFLTQYEFSAADGIGFATGGGHSDRWYKLYIKKVNEQNLFFIGELKGDFADTDFSNYEKEFNRLSTQEYLDEIIEDKENQEKIKQWDYFIEKTNFEFVNN